MVDNRGGIYCIRNLINGKRYVGSAKNFNKRKYVHFRTLRLGIHDNDYLQKSYNKHGCEFFVFEILEVVEMMGTLIEREDFWIGFYKSNLPEFGYNIRNFANNNLGLSYPGINSGSCNPFYGKCHSEETKRKMHDSHIGKPKNISEKGKENISKAHKGISIFVGSDNPAAKLNESDVLEIKIMLRDGVSVKEIMEIFNMSKGAIYRIKTGVAWTHVILPKNGDEEL